MKTPKNLIFFLCVSLGAVVPLVAAAQMTSTPKTTQVGSPASDLSSPAPMSSPVVPSAGSPAPMGSPAPIGSPAPMSSPEPMGEPTTSPKGTSKPPTKSPASLPPSGTSTTKVDINAATMPELVKVKGIGKATANKIMKARPYASLDELVTKKLMSPKQFDAVKAQLSVGP
jgi:DNA uptake protein ComE-like DNA-binding protein